MATNKTQIKEFRDPQRFSAFHESDANGICYVSVLSDEIVEIHYKLKSNDEPVSHLSHACFTTCWARLRLYAALDMLQKRVQYTDTDSVIFSSLPHENNPPLGDFLGDFKDELGEDDFITEFASGRPKKLWLPHEERKRRMQSEGNLFKQ